MIQKRLGKEAEDKTKSVWDAVKEISDLDDKLHYETMALVHNLGMKSEFVNMSITYHYGWNNGIFVNQVTEVKCINIFIIPEGHAVWSKDNTFIIPEGHDRSVENIIPG